MSHFISALFGPRLYRIYGTQRASYEPNFFESGGDKLFSVGNCVYSICMTISPLLIPYVIVTFQPSGYSTLLKTAVTFYALAYSLRTIGRLTNPRYNHFINVLQLAKSRPGDQEVRAALNKYDYQIFAAPIDFLANPAEGKVFALNGEQENTDDLVKPLDLLRDFVAWIAANTFGRRMLYPGSLAIFHSFVNAQLIEGRRKIIEEKRGKRYIIQTEDKNKIDSVFVDNRGKSKNGDILVICCDGNAGFYELGVMKTPADMNYSVLGWNLPGFAESTGTPYPNAILLSMEAVMQFANHKLRFSPNQIVLFAWSIGGFPATWAAANYPQVRAVILDASFDDVTVLAQARMPSAISGLVRYTMQKHLNLPVSKQLDHYQGPVLLIRRWNEEIIITNEDRDESARRASNRANFLLLNLLRKRHPGLITTPEHEKCVFEWLEKDPHGRVIDFPPEDSLEPVVGNRDMISLDSLERTRLIRQLCTRYFVDFMDASHGAPLRAEYFNIPKPIN